MLVNEFGAAGLDAALLEGNAAAGPGPGSAAEGEGAEAGTSGGGSSGSPADIHIKQLAGGCLCCALSNVTALAIAQLLRSVKPDRWGQPGCVWAESGRWLLAGRQSVWVGVPSPGCHSLHPLPRRLLIEPSGLAHPAALVDMLSGEHLGPSLALGPVVCLVGGSSGKERGFCAWQCTSDVQD